jgi:hypothetical protein
MTAAENWILNVSTHTQRLSALRGAAIFQKTKHPIPSIHAPFSLQYTNAALFLFCMHKWSCFLRGRAHQRGIVLELFLHDSGEARCLCCICIPTKGKTLRKEKCLKHVL